MNQMMTAPNPTISSVPAISRQRGMTLLEILIAVSILSIGLLGLAHLQLFGLESTDDSYRRSMASYVASDLSDRMRANRQGAKDGEYDSLDSSSPPTLTDPGCLTSGCSRAQMAIIDKIQWLNHFTDMGIDTTWVAMLDGGKGVISRSGDRVTITITWKNTETSWDTTNSERTNVVRTPTFDVEFDL